jgi:Na+/glutamate symporter
MLDFNLIQEHFVLVVLLGCLVVGYILKHWIKDVDNKYIPTMLAIIGAILNVMVSGMNIENVIYGSVMGLASTGLHQAFTRFIESKKA